MEIADDVIICIAVHGLVSATDSVPQIRVTREAALHMNDVPLPISDSGTVAAPVESLWQSASGDKTARVWDAHLETMSVKSLIAEACMRLVGRTILTHQEMRLAGYPDGTPEIDVCQ
jgi:hypothetical protein